MPCWQDMTSLKFCPGSVMMMTCNLKVFKADNFIPNLMYLFVVIRPTYCRAYGLLII